MACHGVTRPWVLSCVYGKQPLTPHEAQILYLVPDTGLLSASSPQNQTTAILLSAYPSHKHALKYYFVVVYARPAHKTKAIKQPFLRVLPRHSQIKITTVSVRLCALRVSPRLRPTPFYARWHSISTSCRRQELLLPLAASSGGADGAGAGAGTGIRAGTDAAAYVERQAAPHTSDVRLFLSPKPLEEEPRACTVCF